MRTRDIQLTRPAAEARSIRACTVTVPRRIACSRSCNSSRRSTTSRYRTSGHGRSSVRSRLRRKNGRGRHDRPPGRQSRRAGSGGPGVRSFIQGGRDKARRMLYMPALAAIRANPALGRKYAALVEAGKPPKVAITAVMRKLVVLANASCSRIACGRPNRPPPPDGYAASLLRPARSGSATRPLGLRHGYSPPVGNRLPARASLLIGQRSPLPPPVERANFSGGPVPDPMGAGNRSGRMNGVAR